MVLSDLFTGGLVSLAKDILDKIIPDPTARAQAELALIEANQKGELAQLEASVNLALGQIDVNKIEAAGGWFRAGWRPFIGWVCGSGLAYQFIGLPFITWMSVNWLHFQPPPMLDMNTLTTLLFGLLGLGTLRTVEKVKGQP